MPVIPTERLGRQTIVNPAMLRAIMAFPKDEEERRRYLISVYGHAVAETDKLIRQSSDFEPRSMSRKLGEQFGEALEPLGGFSALGQCPSYAEMERRAESRAWPGAIAGDLLISLFQMRVSGREASVNKAVAIALDFLSSATPVVGSPGGRTERYVRQAWEEFKPVCHLWASSRILESIPIDPQERSDVVLALSDALLKLAVTLRPKGARGLLLREDEMWRLPRRYKHRRVITHFKIPPLEDWKLDVLRRYKARKP